MFICCDLAGDIACNLCTFYLSIHVYALLTSIYKLCCYAAVLATVSLEVHILNLNESWRPG